MLVSNKTGIETLVERMHQWETLAQQLQSKVELLRQKKSIKYGRSTVPSVKLSSQAPPSGF